MKSNVEHGLDLVFYELSHPLLGHNKERDLATALSSSMAFKHVIKHVWNNVTVPGKKGNNKAKVNMFD